MSGDERVVISCGCGNKERREGGGKDVLESSRGVHGHGRCW